MLDHDECDDAMATAQHRGRYGWAEYLGARCDLRHHDEDDTPVTQEALTTGEPG